MILSGVLDLGRAYFLYVALEDGAGEGALYLSINPACPKANSGPDCTDPNNAVYRISHAGGGNVDWSGSATIRMCYGSETPSHCTSGDSSFFTPPPYGVGTTVSVSIAYPYRLVTPFVSQIASQVTLNVRATQTIVFEE
jgi:hypothetical protein